MHTAHREPALTAAPTGSPTNQHKTWTGSWKQPRTTVSLTRPSSKRTLHVQNKQNCVIAEHEPRSHRAKGAVTETHRKTQHKAPQPQGQQTPLHKIKNQSGGRAAARAEGEMRSQLGISPNLGVLRVHSLVRLDASIPSHPKKVSSAFKQAS